MPSKDRNTTLQRLPLGTQSFEKLRTNGDLYVDKTMFACKMVQDFNIVFLSRPRRFGKSLMISTLQALFEGKKDLFNGLYAYDNWDWTKTNPIIRIDWTVLPSNTPKKMEEGLVNSMKLRAEAEKISLLSNSPDDCFKELVTKLHSKYHQKAVILIDEYDKPVTDNISSKQLEDSIRITHDFYQVMKGADEHIRFIFLTGVSKLAGLSVFSALNNIEDISLNPDYAGICGYSQDELENDFSAYIDSISTEMNLSKEELLKQINYWYDGYSWDGKTFVHNPFSVLNFFSKRFFASHWFGTGTPRMLFEIIGKLKQPEVKENTVKYVSWDVLNDGYDPQQPDETVTLFQTGYLTVKSIDQDKIYELSFPNTEVEIAYSKSLLDYYDIFSKTELDELRHRMLGNIRNNESELLANTFKHIVELPYQIKNVKEANYHSLLLVSLRALGFKIDGEISTEKGRVDAVMRLNGLTVIMEIKQSEKTEIDTLLKNAMAQIYDRKYYEKYIGKITLLAVAFGKNNEVKCKMDYLER
jgi:hypothetical protein